MTAATVQIYRWTRREYDKMGSPGVFDADARLELVDGEILHRPPQNSRQATAVRCVEEALRFLVVRGNHDLRVQMPLALSEDSEPEPDIAIVRGRLRDYRDHHPTFADLIVEVADTSLDFDQTRKRWLYARAGIPEYWIADLTRNLLDVYREPADGDFTDRYSLRHGDFVRPLCAPDVSIYVADLLP